MGYYVSEQTKEPETLKRCQNDLFYLGTEIIGYNLGREIPHQELCDFIDPEGRAGGKPVKRKLLIGARGIYKTCFGTVARAIQLILREPNVRILLVKKTMAKAEENVNEIKTQFDLNKKLRALAPEIMPNEARETTPWKKSALLVKRDGIFSEPTVTAFGVEGQLAGGHYDYILGDDVVAADRDDLGQQGFIVLREEEVQKAINWYKLTQEGMEILSEEEEQRTEVQFIVNRWGPFDFARYIMDEHSDEYEIKTLAAVNPDGTLLWPNVLTGEVLARKRRSMGDYMYFTQLECRPYAPDSLSFPEECNRYWEGERPEGWESMKPYLLIDLADKKKPHSCNTALVLVYVDAHYHIYVQEAIAYRMDTPAKLKHIRQLVWQYNLDRVHIEENLHHDILENWIREDKIRNKVNYSVQLLHHKNRPKSARISQLEPRHRQGGIHFKRNQNQLLIEFRDFPHSYLMDCIDALAYICDLVRYMPIPKSEDQKQLSFADTFTISQAKKDIKKSMQWGGTILTQQGPKRRKRPEARMANAS